MLIALFHGYHTQAPMSPDVTQNLAPAYPCLYRISFNPLFIYSICMAQFHLLVNPPPNIYVYGNLPRNPPWNTYPGRPSVCPTTNKKQTREGVALPATLSVPNLSCT
jgi:hypothetical protein